MEGSYCKGFGDEASSEKLKSASRDDTTKKTKNSITTKSCTGNCPSHCSSRPPGHGSSVDAQNLDSYVR